MAVSRLRWILGGALALLALAVAARALGSYLDHRLWTGAAAIVLLAAIDVGGFASLLGARRRLARELDGLSRDPPEGEMVAARAARLDALRRAGSPRPDGDALAQATAAEETGRAYLGRYLVATTVLVGLVGTFAGLMETLRTMAPLLHDERLSTAQLVAAPLAGLDITFGASVVGILVTLALALVQGDLLLAEELALARLEERSAHELVPARWPESESAAERAARGVEALHAELLRFLPATVEAAGARVASVAGAEVERLVAGVRAALDGTARETGERVERALAAAAESARDDLLALAGAERERLAAVEERTREAAAEARAAIERASAAVIDSIARADQSLRDERTALLAAAREELATVASAAASSARQASESLRALSEQQAQASARLLGVARDELAALSSSAAASAREASESLRALSEQQAQASAALLASHEATVARTESGLARLVAEHAAHLASSTEALRSAIDRSLVEGGARLDGAASDLARAADGLRAGADALGPPLESLSSRLAPELSALAREVALLAARAAEAESDSVTLDELARVGEGVDRLESLLRLAREEPA